MKPLALTILMTISVLPFLQGQKDLFSGYFRSPVDYDYTITGNFCELRETHFHTGIDIKPAGNDRIFSIGEGYISRIKVDAGGYGNVLYIDHPQAGFTSVYAHLDDFSPVISEVVRLRQLEEESYEVDFHPAPGQIRVVKGDMIGFMGNTGYSFGKHLHFEIRETKSEKPVNPLVFGMKLKDNIPPVITSVAIHGLDADHSKTADIRLAVGDTPGDVLDFPDPVLVDADYAGIAFQAYDKADGSNNKLNIFGVHLYVNDSLVFGYHLDKVSFSQNRQVTGFVDFAVRQEEKKTYSLCYKLPGNTLDFLSKYGNAIITLNPETNTRFRLELEDYFKNRKTITFSVRKNPSFIKTPRPYCENWVEQGTSQHFNEANLTLEIEKTSMYRGFCPEIGRITQEGYETRYRIHKTTEPLKSGAEIHLTPEYPKPLLASKAIVASVDDNGKKLNHGGRWKNGRLNVRIRQFGTYFIEYDTIAPEIRKLDFSTSIVSKRKFRFRVTDDMPTSGPEANDLSYKVWIDGKFVISPYSLKSKVLEIPLDDITAGDHTLKITATDHSGNTGVFTSSFVKKS